MPKFETVIFDFDGTIADTLDVVIEVINAHATEFGIDGIDKFEKEKFRDLSIPYLVEEFKLNIIHLPKLVTKVKRLLANKTNEISLFDGISETFNKLKENNIQLGIVTANNVKIVTDILNDTQEKQFDFIFSVSSLLGKHRVLNKVIKDYELDKEKTIYIGDEVRDIEAAKKSGIKIGAVTWGYNSLNLLEKHEPDFLIYTPLQILDIVL